MDIDIKCGVCNESFEDGGHLFLKCKRVRGVWQELGLDSERLNLISRASATGMMEMILQMKEPVRMRVIVLLWYWWLENRIREGEKSRDPSTIAFAVARMSDEFLAIADEDKQRSCVSRVKAHWHKPPAGFLKINTDGAFAATSGSGGWGFVVRDEDGAVVCAGAGQCEYLLDALHAEALGCLQGIRAAAERGIGRVLIETESALLKIAVESNGFVLEICPRVNWI
jgi:hypothetical protein